MFKIYRDSNIIGRETTAANKAFAIAGFRAWQKCLVLTALAAQTAKH